MALAFKKSDRSAFKNFLDAKYEMLTAAVNVQTQPYYICVDPSDICQLRCPTCPTGIENESRKNKEVATTLYRADRKKLSMDLYDSIMDELGEKLFMIMFYNYGEPLLNPLLPQFISKATSRGIASDLHTNLSLKLSDERISELLNSGLTQLSVSIDGFSQSAYEKHRVGGDVALVRKNLMRLAKERDRLGVDTEIVYKFLVFKHNEHEVEQARQFAQDIGVSFLSGDAFIHDSTWLPSHRQGEKPYYSAEQLDAIFESWKSAGREDYFFEHETHPFWNAVPADVAANAPEACSWHYGYSVITSGGPVAPCCAVSKDQDDFGKIVPGEVSFADVWRNPLYTKSRQTMAGVATNDHEQVDTICSRCYYPKLVHHLYNDLDVIVAQRFFEVFGEHEPEMSQAFAMLCAGIDETNKSAFIAHYDQWLSEAAIVRNRQNSGVREMSGSDATEIVQQFATQIKDLGVDGGKVLDESLLGQSKEDIKSAIVKILAGSVPAEQKAFARELGLVLAFFQPGVGEVGATMDDKKDDDAIWRSDVESEMKNNTREISSRVQALRLQRQ